MIYIKAISVGVACIVILLLPVFYAFYHTSQESLAKTTRKVQWKTIMADKKQVVKLTDGSLVTLLPGSSLSYPDNFNQAERSVTSGGTVYFQVKHDATKPFTITTATAVVTDLGTSFLLHSSPSEQEVIVTEGSVRVVSKKDGTRTTELVAGQTGILKNNRMVRKNTTGTNSLAPVTGRLVFDQAPIEQVASDIAGYYKKRVVLAHALARKNVRVTATFQNKTAEEVFQSLQHMGLTVKKEGKTYIIGRRNFVQRILYQLQ